MTISLEKHVARAIATVWAQGSASCARAAIAAVREREGAECGLVAMNDAAPGELVRVGWAKRPPDPAEGMLAKCPRQYTGGRCVSYCHVDQTDFCAVTGRRV